MQTPRPLDTAQRVTSASSSRGVSPLVDANGNDAAVVGETSLWVDAVTNVPLPPVDGNVAKTMPALASPVASSGRPTASGEVISSLAAPCMPPQPAAPFEQAVRDCTRLRDQGRFDEAIAVVDDCLSTSACKHEQRVALQMHKGRNLQAKGAFARALACYREAAAQSAMVGVSSRTSAVFQIAMAIYLWAESKAPDAPSQDEVDAAWARAASAIDLECAIGKLTDQRRAELVHNEAFCHEQRRNFPLATRRYLVALSLREKTSDTRGQAYTHHRLAVTYLASGQMERATASVEQTLHLYELCGITGQPRVRDARNLANEIAEKRQMPLS